MSHFPLSHSFFHKNLRSPCGEQIGRRLVRARPHIPSTRTFAAALHCSTAQAASTQSASMRTQGTNWTASLRRSRAARLHRNRCAAVCVRFVAAAVGNGEGRTPDYAALNVYGDTLSRSCVRRAAATTVVQSAASSSTATITATQRRCGQRGRSSALRARSSYRVHSLVLKRQAQAMTQGGGCGGHPVADGRAALPRVWLPERQAVPGLCELDHQAHFALNRAWACGYDD